MRFEMKVILSLISFVFILVNCEATYICPSPGMYSVPTDNVKRCTFFEFNQICNSTTTCLRNGTICCPSHIGRLCPDECLVADLRVTKPGYCPRNIYDVSRNCTPSQFGVNLCYEDGNCHVKEEKCCTDNCNVKRCVKADSTDKCLQPIEEIECPLEEPEHDAYYYYQPYVTSWGTVLGVCRKSNTTCLGTINSFVSLTECENSCSKRGCELFTCLHPDYGVNGTTHRSSQCPDNGFQFDMNGCYACSCSTKSACENIKCPGSVKCHVEITNCGHDICPRRGICISQANGVIPKMWMIFIIAALIIKVT